MMADELSKQPLSGDLGSASLVYTGHPRRPVQSPCLDFVGVVNQPEKFEGA